MVAGEGWPKFGARDAQGQPAAACLPLPTCSSAKAAHCYPLTLLCPSLAFPSAPGGDFHSRTALGMYDHIKEAIDKGGWCMGRG